MLTFDKIIELAFEQASDDRNGQQEVIIEDGDYSHIVTLYIEHPTMTRSETYDSHAEYSDGRDDIISARTEDIDSNIVKVWK